MLGGGLPGAYRRVEWIGCTGTQYLDTGYTPNIDSDVEVEFDNFDINGNNYAGTGGAGSAGTWVNLSWGTDYTSSYASFGNNVDKYFSKVSSGTYWNVGKHSFRVSKVGCWADGILRVTFSDVTFGITTDTYCVGARMSYGAIARYIKANIYSVIIREGNRLVRNFIPCVRKSDSKPGMYDTVSHTFYTNAGTGEFIVPN